MQTNSNTKRLIKNSIFLYARMFVGVIFSLYTSRIILQALGVVDFGIYNVVGGVVVMMSIINSAMMVSTQRYLSFSIGKGDEKETKRIFSLILTIFGGLALLLLLLGETLGAWFLNNVLSIPSDRLDAAVYVYQFSLFACIVTLLQNPYHAMIISSEKMDFFAYMGLIDYTLKLLIALFVSNIANFDKLVIYGILMFFCSVSIASFYFLYCIFKIPQSRFAYYWNKEEFCAILVYSGWNMFGAVSGAAKGQGINILINVFFGPIVNAARGIAYQISHVLQQFFSSFYTAVQPQIIKYYAQGDYRNFNNLVLASSRFAYYLILFISLPIVVETDFIVTLWLGATPEYVVVFFRWIVIITAIDCIATPLMTAIHATGKNQLYQFLVGGMTIAILPLSYIALKLGYSPTSVFIISSLISIINFVVRLYLAKLLANIAIINYITSVIYKIMIVTITSMIPLLILKSFLSDTALHSVIVILFSIFLTILSIYFCGITESERKYIRQHINRKIKGV